MPELPEVQTVCDDLIKAGILSATIKDAIVSWPRILHQSTVESFVSNIKNKKIQSVERRGKYIVIKLNQNWFLMIHLRMSGRINFLQSTEQPQKHEHVVLHLDKNRTLKYHDTRKFGRWYLTQNPDSILGHLGVEPLSKNFTLETLLELINKSKTKKIKPFLLDQTNIAGIGNIYADESLFLSQIHPETKCHKVPIEKIKRLHKAIQKVLNLGIQNMGTTLGTGNANFYSVSKRKGKNKDRLKVFRREGLPCLTCNSIIQKTVVAQRGTHFCPQCQIKNK